MREKHSFFISLSVCLEGSLPRHPRDQSRKIRALLACVQVPTCRVVWSSLTTCAVLTTTSAVLTYYQCSTDHHLCGTDHHQCSTDLITTCAVLTTTFTSRMVAFAAIRLLVLLPLVSVSSLAPTVSTLDSVCRIISGYHCDDYFQLDQQCGTDGITYNNMCEFSKAHCQLRDLHIAHTGVCETGHVVQSTRVPGAHGTYEFFCQTLVCGDDREVVCASNGHTYLNLCLFESQRCHNSSLTIVDYQACPSL